MNKKKLIWQVPFLLFLIIGTVVILGKQPPFRANEGLVLILDDEVKFLFEFLKLVVNLLQLLSSSIVHGWPS